MQKHIKPAAHHPKAGETISLAITHTVQVQNQVAVIPAKAGKLNYLGNPSKLKKTAAKLTQPAPKNHRRIEHRTYAQGKYIGVGNRLTAFVWLDNEPALCRKEEDDPK
jgi:hypothetical protein